MKASQRRYPVNSQKPSHKLQALAMVDPERRPWYEIVLDWTPERRPLMTQQQVAEAWTAMVRGVKSEYRFSQSEVSDIIRSAKAHQAEQSAGASA